MAQKDLLLFNEQGVEFPYEDTQSKLDKTTFKQYQVVNGKWILYKNTDFNYAQAGGTSSDILVADQATAGKINLPFSPNSIRRLEDSVDSVTVFEHSYYGGKAKEYTEACTDVNPDFQSSTSKGASSIIVWPNKPWELFMQPGLQGGRTKVEPGYYLTSAEMGFSNDALQSLRPL